MSTFAPPHAVRPPDAPRRPRRALCLLAFAVVAGCLLLPRTVVADAATRARLGQHEPGQARKAPRPRPAVTRSVKQPGLRPIDQPSARHRLVLLKIGDSLGEELGFGLHDALDHNPDVTVIQDAVGDSGLARPDYYNWPVHLAQELAADHPSAVVVMLGGDDAQGFVADGQTVAFGTPKWHTLYAGRVAALMSEATAAGAHVIWVGLPIMGSAFFSSEMAKLNAIYAAEAASHPGVTFVPTWALFANASGSYSASLPASNGQLELMRNPDGVHFSGAGADRLAAAVIVAMDHAWKIRL